MRYVKLHRHQLLKTLSRQTYSCLRTLCANAADDLKRQPLKPKLNYDFLCNPANTQYIERLVSERKNIGNIHKVLELYNKLKVTCENSAEYQGLERELEEEALKIPNDASQHLWEYGKEPKVVEYVNPKREFPFPPLEFSQLAQRLNILRTENLGNVTGTRSYFFKGPLAELEHGLVRYSVSHLLRKGFTLMSVPDLLYADIIEGCGMNTKGEQSQGCMPHTSEPYVPRPGPTAMPVYPSRFILIPNSSHCLLEQDYKRRTGSNSHIGPSKCNYYYNYTTNRKASKVYHIVGPNEGVCLAGTAEMSLGGYLRGRQLETEELPLRLAAVSRCYRAEGSSSTEEKGIFRVHIFTKVEMFGVTATDNGQESHELYSEMVDLQKELYSKLGLHFQVLDMPLNDLGAPAFTKTDIEAWMPGRGMFGEISSASNCTDYQAARLNITYRDASGRERLAHTVNGTACAVPRLIIALCETFQEADGTITLPPALHPYLLGSPRITRPANPCRTTWINSKAYQGPIVPARAAS